MQLKKNSLSARLFGYLYGYHSSELPQDGCYVIPRMIWLWIGMPLHFGAFVIRNNDDNYLKNALFTLAIYFIVFYTGALGLSITLIFPSIKEWNFLFSAPIFLLNGLFIIALIYAIVKLVSYLPKESFLIKRNVKKRKESTIFTFIKAYYKAKKEKYCPKIEWI